ncbi:MAG: tetratricopeptide repeat protein [Novosphingobium sp.]|nr:tetratricopeptide repeat protein [Novosphingobium sp.]
MACAALPAVAESADIEQPSVSNLPAMPLTDLVEHLLRTGRTDEAAHVLEQVLKAQPDDQQAVFLTGIVAMAKGDHKRAIRIFRAMLIDHPEAVRVRLELARAFFADKDYANIAPTCHPPAAPKPAHRSFIPWRTGAALAFLQAPARACISSTCAARLAETGHREHRPPAPS